MCAAALFFIDKKVKKNVIRKKFCFSQEGKFYRFKTANHPHTNMAKVRTSFPDFLQICCTVTFLLRSYSQAALNMMTRTSAAEYAKTSGIFMTAVDTGWYVLACAHISCFVLQLYYFCFSPG